MPASYEPGARNQRPGFGSGPRSSQIALFQSQLKREQAALKKKGFYRGSIDGVWGPLTKSAFEKAIRAESDRLRRHQQAGDVSQLDRLRLIYKRFAGGIGAATPIFQEYAKTLTRAEKNRNAALERQRQQLLRFQAEAVKEEQRFRNSLKGKALQRVEDFTKNKVVGGIFKVLSVGFEKAVAAPLTAAQRLDLLQRQAGERPKGLATNTLGVNDYLRVLAGSFGFRGQVEDRLTAQALDETNDPDQRERLREAGQLESPGERIARDLAIVGLRLTGNTEEARRRLDTPNPIADIRYAGTAASRVADLSLQLFADPLNYIGVGLIGKVDDVVKGARLLASQAGKQIIEDVARAATRAAEREVAPGLGDARLLTKLVPSLREAESTELVGALVSKSGDDAIEFISKNFGVNTAGETAVKLERAGLSPEAAKQAEQVGERLVQQGQALTARIKAEGMTTGTRRALLELSLGRVWKPDVSNLSRALVGATSRVINPRFARGLLNVPSPLRQVKGDSWARRAGLALKGNAAGYLGDAVDPATVAAKNLVATTKAETRAAAGLARQRRKLEIAELLTKLAGDVGKLPTNEYQEVLAGRLRGLAGKVIYETGGQAELLGLKSTQKGLAKGLSAQTAKELVQLNKDIALVQKLGKYGREELLHNFKVEMQDYQFASGRMTQARMNWWQRAFVSVARTFNDVPLSQINLHNVGERTKIMSDWVIAMGGTRAEADQVFARMARPMTVERTLDEAKQIQITVVRNMAVRQGLKGDQLTRLVAEVEENGSQFLRDSQGWAAVLDNRPGRYVSENDKIYDLEGAKSAQVLSQTQYNLGLVDPHDVRNAARLMKYKEDPNLFNRAALAADLATDAINHSYYRWFHRPFKYMALVLGAPRYILRVAVMDERQRMYDHHGWKSLLEISGRHKRKLNAKMLDETGGQRWATGWEEVGIDNLPMHFLDKRGIEIVGHGKLKPGDPGFEENAWHILMFQVRPEDDIVQSVLIDVLHLPNEAEAMEIARDSIKEALTNSKNGRDYIARAARMNKKAKDVDYLIDNTARWMKEVMPTREAVEARINGKFSLKKYKENPEWHPAETWGDKYSNMWAPNISVAETARRWTKLAARLTIESPTTSLNRQPFFWAEFNKEWEALVAGGIRPERANELANARAIKRTNQILFDSRVKSRFAQKMDVFFPFQQAREEVVRVAVKTLKEHPDRVAKRARLLALAINNGINNGIIEKNYYGDWQMKVPGNGVLSRALSRWTPSWVPFADGIRQIAGSEYSFNLKDLLFVNEAWGIVPRPSGPWWTVTGNLAANRNPELIDGPFDDPALQKLWQEYLFGYGTNMRLVPRPEITKLYMALTGDDHVLWEPFAGLGLGRGERERELEQLKDRLTGEVYAELARQYVKAGKDPTTITPQEVKDAVRGQLAVHGLLGLFFPASTRVDQAGQDDYQDAIKHYTVDGQVQWAQLAASHPEFVGYLIQEKYRDPLRERYTDANGDVDVAKLRAENPAYFDAWLARKHGDDVSNTERMKQGLILARNYFNAEEMKKALDQQVENNAAFKEYNHLRLALQNGWMRPAEAYTLMAAWEKGNGDRLEAQGIRVKNYRKRVEFDDIWKATAWNADERAKLLDEWQFKFNASDNERARLAKEAAAGQWHKNVWMEARNPLDLQVEFVRNNPKGLSPIAWAHTNLSPAERIKYFQVLSEQTQDVQDYQELRREIGKVSSKYQKLLYQQGDGKRYLSIEDAAEKEWRDKEAEAFDAMGRKYDEIEVVTKQMQALYDQAFAKVDAAKAAGRFDPSAGPLFDAAKRLKNKRSVLFAEIKGIKNGLYRKHPNLQSVEDEVRFMTFVNEHDFKLGKTRLDDSGVPYQRSYEERQFFNMPDHIKKDYVDSLLEQLTLEPGQYRTKRGTSRLQWSYLTEFQQDLLRQQLNSKQIDLIKRRDAQDNEFSRGGRGGRRRGGRWQIDGIGFGEGFGELVFAFEMFKKYNKRGSLAEPKRELAEYKALGDNEILKKQYLRSHPRLADWFRLGPMQQMPPALSMIVRNIMVKHGKWEDVDGVRTWDELTELGFAKHMLRQYNRRKGNAPEAYELWLKMPTGTAKFKYFQKHPEIERWLQMGPMSSMPDMYKEVVRDIMMKYGEWTKQTDPLSQLIQEYYEAPTYAKQDFLEAHPEILAYWRAIRTGRDRILFDMAQVYFSLKTKEQKDMYLEAHPEVQEYFIQERRRRYEAFANNVARYLGKTPELFEHYMADQTRFIKELLDKFGQRPLLAATARVVGSRAETGRHVTAGNRRSQ